MEPATLQKKLGTAIRARRAALGFGQDSFADRICMHRAYYASIERGERNFTLHTICRVAEGLATTLADLMADARV